ncbi:sodium/hydrogen exchanger family-like protein [Aureococcus anophagefferens]|nr:sodium/hydrogen exchanger family-like protein [Aureococcus anophagefferens]
MLQCKGTDRFKTEEALKKAAKKKDVKVRERGARGRLSAEPEPDEAAAPAPAAAAADAAAGDAPRPPAPAGAKKEALGSPSLVGEIVAGVILGPHLLDFVPNAAVLKVIGEVGLVFHALEVGLMVDVELLEILGAASPGSAFVVGASMASISTGIALNVLRVGSVLNQPIGQLIIAAATVNEVVNIALLTCRHRPKAVLGSLFLVAMLLIPACKYTGSSELLGAFLAGLCFCSDHVVHETWDRQVKRVAHWLMRFFFACTIGFSIPIAAVARADVFVKALLLCCTIVGKLAVGVFAQPLDADHFWILALAWGEWGEMQCEMSFFIAAAAFKKKHGGAGVIDENTYNAVCLAVLVSMVACPAWLRSSLERYERRAKFQIAEAIADTADVSGAAHATYFCLQTKSHAHWDQSDHLQTSIARLGCEIIDYRQWHPNDHLGLAHCVNEVYIRDDALRLPTAMEMTTDQVLALQRRIDRILDAVREALHEDERRGAEIRIQRWLPGCHEVTDVAGVARLEANDDAASRVEALTTDGDVYRGADGKLHGAGHGPWRHAKRSLQRRVSFGKLDDAPATPDGGSEASSTRGAFRTPGIAATPRRVSSAGAHHELDGFVHHDAHHPFALPDDDDHEKEDDLVFGRHRPPSMSSVDLEEEKRADWHHHDVEVASDSGFAQTLVELSPCPESPASGASGGD